MLSENFKMVGRGDFTVRSEKGYDDEIQMLNDTFDSMVGQIEILLNDVKHEQENLRQTELKTFAGADQSAFLV
jgi:two-component system sensor histidine kinase YesM